jgi:hypothetical protein
MLLEITPLADGSAYAKSFTSGLWYLRSNKVVRVVFVESNSPAPLMFFEITPLLDGSAYATSWARIPSFGICMETALKK